MTFMTSALGKFEKKCVTLISPSIFKSLAFRYDVTAVNRQINTTSKKHNEDSGPDDKSKKVIVPPEPEHCCMSGCANCVWIKYAEELVHTLGSQGGDIAKAKILEQVKDPNLRAFLMIELEDLFQKKDT